MESVPSYVAGSNNHLGPRLGFNSLGNEDVIWFSESPRKRGKPKEFAADAIFETTGAKPISSPGGGGKLIATFLHLGRNTVGKFV